MCGEHSGDDTMGVGDLGSSPHVRGAHVARPLDLALVGIIPACAGSTFVWHCHVHLCRDHPRMCGEHDEGRADIKKPPGSSPHVRGAPIIFEAEQRWHGIIPACAGSTLTSGRSRPPRWDHPRMCGEHVLLILLSPFVLGSSPHVRGALLVGT